MAALNLIKYRLLTALKFTVEKDLILLLQAKINKLANFYLNYFYKSFITMFERS